MPQADTTRRHPMKQLKCENCQTEISTKGILKLRENSEAFRTLVPYEELRRELAKPHPHITCFNCDAEDNVMVRSDLYDELTDGTEVDGLDEFRKQQMYARY